MTRRVQIIFILSLAIGASGIALLWWLDQPRGVEVVVRNMRATAIRDVRLYQYAPSDRPYRLGNLQPLETRSVRIFPIAEGSLIVDVTNAAGSVERLTAGGYVGNYNEGSMAIDVRDEEAILIKEDLR